MEAPRLAGARYVVQGGVDRLADRLRVTATLFDGANRPGVWSHVFDSSGNDSVGLREDVSRFIYDSLAGLRGKIDVNEEQVAWRKSSVELSEYDYFLRGMSLYSRSTLPDILNARAVFQEGLGRYPDSALLRLRLAWTHLWMAMNQVNSDPGPDIEQAWVLANQARSAPSLSPMEDWLAHWLMAFLYQWRDNDFSRSVAEARKAVELAP